MREMMKVVLMVLSALIWQGCATERMGYSPEFGRDVVLRDATSGLPLPKTMLLIDEKNLGTISTSEVESMAISRIKESGGQVVDQDMVRSNLKRDQDMLRRAGDNRGAAALGLQYGADVIIVGEAVAKPSARRIGESNLRSYEAVVTVKAVRTDNSELLMSASEASTIVALDDISGSSKALKAAAGSAFDKLLPAMARQYRSKPRGSATSMSRNNVSLTVGGIDQMYKLKSVREKLKTLDGVVSVSQKNYTAGVALFDLVIEKPTEELAEDIVINAPSGMKFQALDIAPGKIELRALEAKK